jgi:ABC-type transport system involved in multi-copper enzyme maturation permease subunit
MNRTILRALFLDAFSQVMDNRMFRLLVLICIVLIAPSFLIGFREDGVHLLFGWKFFPYEEFYQGMLHAGSPHSKTLHIELIQTMQTKIVSALAGTLGILFCIAATAFFVPRMLEKGAADTLFTKPISRVTFLASRYFAGLVFVGALSFLLVFGIHLGLLIVSGYSDPAFLWCTLTLIYVYGLVQTVSVLTGVLTRSSVVAILCTLVFFTFNGCVQAVWKLQEHSLEVQESRQDDEAARTARAQIEDRPFLAFLRTSIQVLHFTLPKTSDADVLTRKVRTIVVGRSALLLDEAAKVGIEDNPEGFRLDTPGGTVDLRQSPARWVSDGKPGGEADRLELTRRSRFVERPSPGAKPEEKPRAVLQSTGQAANELLKALEGRSGVVGKPIKEHERSARLSYDFVAWSEEGPSGKLARERLFFAVDDWIYELDVSLAPTDRTADRMSSIVGDFVESVHVSRDEAAYLDPEAWYETRFGWSSPLKFNAFFSIGSSLAFAALMLAVAAWRLSRIDF